MALQAQSRQLTCSRGAVCRLWRVTGSMQQLRTPQYNGTEKVTIQTPEKLPPLDHVAVPDSARCRLLRT